MIGRYWPLALVLVAATGCASRWVNQGRLVSVMAAGQVGMFHRQTGHWPQTRSELIARGCPEIDRASLDAAPLRAASKPTGCQFFVNLPYQLELQPRAADLRVVLRDASGDLVCRIRVAIPAHDGRDALSPQITLKTTWTGCPGEGNPQ